MEQNNNSDNTFPDVAGSEGSSSVRPPTPAVPPAPIPVFVPGNAAQKPPRRSLISIFVRYIFVMILISSLVLNLYLAMIMAGGMQEHVYRSGDRQQRIALIDLQGTIDMNTAEDVRLLLRRADQDNTIKGVILVVNSPGGQVSPSEMINQYLCDFKARNPEKKVYVSVQQVGASGAYWAAAAGDKIYAQTNSAVGSIGVIYMNLVMEKTLKEKLGIEPVVIKSSRSPYKDRGSPFRMPTEQERQKITREIDRIHTRFVEVVSRGRNIHPDDAWKLADGNVYDGPEAKGKKLIDEVGFLDNAIDDLTETLKLTDPMVIRFVKPPTIRELLTSGSSRLDNPFDIQQHLEKWATTCRIQALWLGR